MNECTYVHIYGYIFQKKKKSAVKINIKQKSNEFEIFIKIKYLLRSGCCLAYNSSIRVVHTYICIYE